MPQKCWAIAVPVFSLPMYKADVDIVDPNTVLETGLSFFDERTDAADA